MEVAYDGDDNQFVDIYGSVGEFVCRAKLTDKESFIGPITKSARKRADERSRRSDAEAQEKPSVNDQVNALADDIVELIQAKIENKDGLSVAKDAVLLAQHRLFGDYYLSQLLAGLYPR